MFSQFTEMVGYREIKHSQGQKAHCSGINNT